MAITIYIYQAQHAAGKVTIIEKVIAKYNQSSPAAPTSSERTSLYSHGTPESSISICLLEDREYF